jgi:hypothetical protein
VSKEIGNRLPDALYATLYAARNAEQSGRAIVISTVDRHGWAHPALLSYREVSAADPATLQVVTFEGTRTAANMRSNGKLTLIFVDERMTYYVKGTATEIPSKQGASFATMTVVVEQVLKDAPGAGEKGANITSGITFEETRP